jgi:hypothetical protein
MKSILLAAVLGAAVTQIGVAPNGDLSNADIVQAFSKQGIRINAAEASGIRANVLIAVKEARAHGIGNSKVDFAAVEIAQDLGLDTSTGSNTVRNVVAAIGYLKDRGATSPRSRPLPPPPPPPLVEWESYFDSSVNLWNQMNFMSLVREKQFFPVKISWEDIGRNENSAWGDRISDVGIWVRKVESDPTSARLALSVRRDSNFRDKILMVPADRIKVHQRFGGGRTVEKTLPQRLAELGVASATRDRNVIVSNQFAIVPVPSRAMHGAWPDGVPPRAAFNFSIFPYGSTNLVITDVIEGSHEAVVGRGGHQLLFANVDGEKAPFTASRAEDRPDLLKLEKELRAQGMDVDVQRYYLIQVPLRKGMLSIRLSNMGAPPMPRQVVYSADSVAAGAGAASPQSMPPPPPPPSPAVAQENKSKGMEIKESARKAEPGLARVAIGHGEAEGPYFAGAGFGGARADEPVRVTVIYFVTPVGPVTRKDMVTFTAAFSQWDSQAIWGGSFVTKETTK